MEPTKRCPMCGELILRIAIRCKHCHSDLSGYEAADQSQSGPHAQPASGLPWAPPPVAQPQPQPHHAAPQPNAESHSQPHPRVDRLEYVAPETGDFEQRFLDFAFKTNLPINPATVAYALKIKVDEAAEGLEDLAARDVLAREVDPRGVVSFTLPGRSAVAAQMGTAQPSTAITPYSSPPTLLYEPSMNGLMRVPTESTALAGLLLNVIFLPGLGSLIGGKTSAGVFQLLMFLLGIPLCFVVIGFPMVVGSWIWGLVTGVNMLAEAKQSRGAA